MNKICGNCHYYANSPMHGPWCTKNRKEVSYLQSAFDCWTEPGTAPAEEMQMKVCSRCGRKLPITNFGRHSRTKDGYQPCCRECQSEMNKGHKKRQPVEHNEPPKKAPEYTPEQLGIGKGRRADHPTYIDKDTGITMKWCKGCKQYKPIDEFHHNKANKDGHEFDCKVCHNARVSAQHARRRAEKKALLEEAQKEAMMKKVLAEMPAASSEPEVLLPSDEPQTLGIQLKVDTPIVNNLMSLQKTRKTIDTASDDELVEELKRRGYTGNIIKKVSFIL